MAVTVVDTRHSSLASHGWPAKIVLSLVIRLGRVQKSQQQPYFCESRIDCEKTSCNNVTQTRLIFKNTEVTQMGGRRDENDEEQSSSSDDGCLSYVLESESVGKGMQVLIVREQHGVDHSLDPPRSFEIEAELVRSISGVDPIVPSAPNVNSKRSTNRRRRLLLLADQKRVYDLLAEGDNDLVKNLDAGKIKGDEEVIRLEAVRSHPELPLSSASHVEASRREGEQKVSKSASRQTKKRKVSNTATKSSKRAKHGNGTSLSTAGTNQKKVTVDHINAGNRAAHATTGCPSLKTVLVEVVPGDFVQVHGKERAKRAIAKGRALVVQCFVCLAQYQVDRSAEALYCSNCESLTRLGKGLRKHDRRMSPDEVYQHDRRIAEQIHSHGFEEPIQRTNRRQEKIREETLRIR
jgi:hypothetical protein